ncbi:CD36-like protein, putative [Bodo saltans]|uniref:CD36-like protein, putative n=1 Tax=Bodo saltans TaxID=75058 RepID=A0A0S4JSY1_BODSA|nr:CD36-like protein, putative [Bodo saltans]|eukprot:CUG92204.1 CD36-like protein, putative [Bodo saltans]
MVGIVPHIIVGILAIAMIVIGAVIPFVIDHMVKKSLRDKIVVSSTEDEGYNDWSKALTGEVTRKFLGYELTNPAAFMAGAAPNFQEWSMDDQVWFNWMRTNHNSNFSADGTQVTTRTASTYYLRDDSPGSDQKYFLTVNWAFVTLVSQTGSEQALWTVVANAMMGRMFTAGIASWAADTTYCYLGTVCGLAQYGNGGHAIPTFNATQLSRLAATLPSRSWIGQYLTIVPVIYTTTDATVRATNAAIANSLFTFFTFGDPTYADPLNFARYLTSLVANTSTTITAAYATTPYGLFFKNATLHNHVFGFDPLLSLLGTQISIISNASSTTNIIKTGHGDDFYMGMDYFTETYSRFVETRYPGGNFSVEGRQLTIPPFQARPDTFQIFFPTAMRFVRTYYTGEGTVKRLPTWYYAFDTTLLLAINPFFGTFVTGTADLSYVSSGAPIWATKPRQADVDPAWRSRSTGIPDPTAAGESYIQIEGVTGIGVEGAAKLLFNCYVNFTKAQFTGFSTASGEYIIPMFEAIDYRIVRDNKADDLYKAVVWAPRVHKIIRLVLVIVGCVLFAAVVASFVYARHAAAAESSVENVSGDKDLETKAADPAPGNSTACGHTPENSVA